MSTAQKFDLSSKCLDFGNDAGQNVDCFVRSDQIHLRRQQQKNMETVERRKEEMPETSTKRYRRYSGSFWSGLLDVLSGAGNVQSSFDPPRYPKDAQHQDLKRIG